MKIESNGRLGQMEGWVRWKVGSDGRLSQMEGQVRWKVGSDEKSGRKEGRVREKSGQRKVGSGEGWVKRRSGQVKVGSDRGRLRIPGKQGRDEFEKQYIIIFSRPLEKFNHFDSGSRSRLGNLLSLFVAVIENILPDQSARSTPWAKNFRSGTLLVLLVSYGTVLQLSFVLPRKCYNWRIYYNQRTYCL
jgi:hypothetical protein